MHLSSCTTHHSSLAIVVVHFRADENQAELSAMPAWAASIRDTGFYGFPLHPRTGFCKVSAIVLLGNTIFFFDSVTRNIIRWDTMDLAIRCRTTPSIRRRYRRCRSRFVFVRSRVRMSSPSPCSNDAIRCAIAKSSAFGRSSRRSYRRSAIARESKRASACADDV